jgi:hypothetical protein
LKPDICPLAMIAVVISKHIGILLKMTRLLKTFIEFNDHHLLTKLAGIFLVFLSLYMKFVCFFLLSVPVVSRQPKQLTAMTGLARIQLLAVNLTTGYGAGRRTGTRRPPIRDPAILVISTTGAPTIAGTAQPCTCLAGYFRHKLSKAAMPKWEEKKKKHKRTPV